jgi:hypothetical protein
MKRNEFISKLIRYALLALLSLIVLVLGRKVVLGADCTTCPGKNSCKGLVDCYRI